MAVELEKKGADLDLNKTLLKEVIRSHLLANPKTIANIRDSQDCFFDVIECADLDTMYIKYAYIKCI